MKEEPKAFAKATMEKSLINSNNSTDSSIWSFNRKLQALVGLSSSSLLSSSTTLMTFKAATIGGQEQEAPRP